MNTLVDVIVILLVAAFVFLGAIRAWDTLLEHVARKNTIAPGFATHVIAGIYVIFILLSFAISLLLFIIFGGVL